MAKTNMAEPQLKPTPRAFRILLKENGVESKEILIFPDHSPVSILHDYIKACGFGMSFIFGTAKDGHAATVFLENVAYSTGYGPSKLAAKQEACKRCLKIIIPHIKNYWSNDGGLLDETAQLDDPNLENMDVISICRKLNEPFPYTCLKTCLKLNFGLNGLDLKNLETSYTQIAQRFQCTLSVAGVNGEGIGENKKMAKEMASYSLLMKLHPVVQTFSGILHIYGKTSSTMQHLQLVKQEEQKVLEHAFHDQPAPIPVNFQLLAKLRHEMQKLTISEKFV